ncbi:uncharacterized protein LOC131522871 isoform X2 [Onychostoma macrolepis]|uniref:uncharacterized protein LOC131522871 isoform X2 n=1 Tax=Onychostoma macrolepis TaxID=369639 RepID=UPI00272B53ED|nr:uncharacterized protein LOC131522871 isoform X2 [Onychostoma macrolepis]
MSFLKEISPLVMNNFLSGTDVLSRYAAQITAEIQQGERRNYNEVLDLSSGDLHRGGIKPITFVRQVLAACVYPALLEDDSLPLDVKQRAQSLLRECEGGSVGSYTDSSGLAKIKHCVSQFITRRDGGVPSSPNNFFINSGSQTALMIMLKLLIRSEDSCRTGVLIPVPTYASFTLALEKQGAAIIPYYLCEEQGWTLQVEELRKALHTGRNTCNPVALYICNPGNPTEDRTNTITSMDPRPSSPSEILEELVNTLRASRLPPPPPQSASASPMALLAAYAGDSAECGGFLLQMALYLEMQPQKFPTERSKVAFLISLLSGRALIWARAIWDANTAIINSYEAFTHHFKEVFGSSTGAFSVSDQLLRLRQGTSSTHGYTLQFRTLAASSGWNEAALISAYRQGLESTIRKQMAIYDDSLGLEGFMQRANRIS